MLVLQQIRTQKILDATLPLTSSYKYKEYQQSEEEESKFSALKNFWCSLDLPIGQLCVLGTLGSIINVSRRQIHLRKLTNPSLQSQILFLI